MEKADGKRLREDSLAMDELAEHSLAMDESAEQDWANMNLFEAIDGGDLRATKHFLDQCPDALTSSMTQDGDTPLHKAVLSGHNVIVREIVRRIHYPKALEIKNKDGSTSLAYAAAGGIVSTAECLVQKCPGLVSIGNKMEMIPVVVASMYGHRDMACYLYRVTPLADLDPSAEDEVKGKNGVMLATTCIMNGQYDIVLDLLSHYPSLAYTRDHDNDTAMMALAHIPSAFPSVTNLPFWKWWIYSCIPTKKLHQDLNHPRLTKGKGKHLVQRMFKFLEYPFLDIYALKLEHIQVRQILIFICLEISDLDGEQLSTIGLREALFKAIEYGIVEYVEEILKHYPNIVWLKDPEGRNVFFLAVIHRQEKILSLIYKMQAKKNILASFGDSRFSNALHLAATRPPAHKLNRIPGAAFQMQRELQWFKEVRSLVHPKYRHMPSMLQKKTPYALFIEDHKELLVEGEKWMKERAESCSVVAALITTMMFSSAFTIPGGFSSDDGMPLYLNRKMFMVFVVSISISLFSSSISLLMFLGILTSRYRETDFLWSLPTKFIVGLGSLFLAMVSMMVSFVAMLTLVLSKKADWVLMPAMLLAM